MASASSRSAAPSAADGRGATRVAEQRTARARETLKAKGGERKAKKTKHTYCREEPVLGALTMVENKDIFKILYILYKILLIISDIPRIF